MSEPSAPLYPELPEPFRPKNQNNGGHKVRMAEINRIRDKLERDLKTRRRLCKHYKRFFNALHGLSVGSGGIGTALAGVTLGVMSNPTIILPVAIVNVSFGALSTLTGIWSKLVRKRIDKHQRLYLEASGALRSINEILSEGLKDCHINDEEFRLVLAAYQDYLWSCKSQSDAFNKSTLVEKEVVLKRTQELKKENIDIIISSNVLRAKETAEIISKEIGVEVVYDERIREKNFGKHSGETFGEHAKIYKEVS